MAEEPQTEQLSEEIKTLIRGALPLRRVIRSSLVNAFVF